MLEFKVTCGLCEPIIAEVRVASRLIEPLPRCNQFSGATGICLVPAWRDVMNLFQAIISSPNRKLDQ